MIKFVLNFALRLVMLPILILLCASGIMVDILERVFSFVAGPCYWFLVASMVYSAVSSQWLNLGIMGGLFLCLVVLTLLVGFIGSTIEICRDNVRGLYEFG